MSISGAYTMFDNLLNQYVPYSSYSIHMADCKKKSDKELTSFENFT